MPTNDTPSRWLPMAPSPQRYGNGLGAIRQYVSQQECGFGGGLRTSGGDGFRTPGGGGSGTHDDMVHGDGGYKCGRDASRPQSRNMDIHPIIRQMMKPIMDGDVDYKMYDIFSF